MAKEALENFGYQILGPIFDVILEAVFRSDDAECKDGDICVWQRPMNIPGVHHEYATHKNKQGITNKYANDGGGAYKEEFKQHEKGARCVKAVPRRRNCSKRMDKIVNSKQHQGYGLFGRNNCQGLTKDLVNKAGAGDKIEARRNETLIKAGKFLEDRNMIPDKPKFNKELH
mmetsp:Transcript_24987/g.21853  ORF Transcript_24987/g.21853 Transcript_24987/m.21853 type:complete len:172 (-) Transcript_24987:55-570(-)